MTGRPRVLLVEDDETLRLALEDNLSGEGYDVAAAATVGEAEAHLTHGPFDLAVLDLMLPDGDGYTLCRRIKKAGSARAVLMLTARTLEEDLVRGFEAGADDYVEKPYRLRELLARTRALLRRAAVPPEESFTFGGHRLDLRARTLTGPRGEPIELTRTELDLLACLLRGRGRVLTRDEILDEVWGRDVNVDARTVDNFVLALRRKVRPEPPDAFQIATVRGLGYRLVVEEERA